MSDIVERLRGGAPNAAAGEPWFLLDEPKLEELLTEAADTITALRAEVVRMREALEFYADKEAWNQPPVKTVSHELLGPAYENAASRVRLDRGKIARAALTQTKDTTDDA